MEQEATLTQGYHRPESQGLVCASIYIILLILFIPYAFAESITTHYDTERRSREGLVVDEFPHYQVCSAFVWLYRVLRQSQLGVQSYQYTYHLYYAF